MAHSMISCRTQLAARLRRATDDQVRSWSDAQRRGNLSADFVLLPTPMQVITVPDGGKCVTTAAQARGDEYAKPAKH
jgi:hypothetical protein